MKILSAPVCSCFALLLWSSCAKMDDYYDEPRRDVLIRHQWKIVRETANGVDQLQECRKDNLLLFDGSGYVTEKNPTPCHPSEKEVYRYDYQLLNYESELLISAFNGQEHHFHITRFSDTTIELTEQEPGKDLIYAAITLSRI